jgi:Mn2+/Fe2+ NRAMP family transporter
MSLSARAPDPVDREHAPVGPPPLPPRLGLLELWKIAGPGVVTGSADNDPAGITTYSVVGAQSGFSQNWLLLLATPLLIVVQQMAAKIGNVTKTDFASVIRTHYGARASTVAVLAVVVANLLTLSADLEMLAAVTGLISHVPFVYFVVPFAALMAYVTIFGDYRAFSRYLLWIGAVFVAYIVAAFLARPNWSEALRQTVVPQLQFTPAYFMAAVGLLGTTITPYLFFWQTSGEIEERRGVQSLPRTNLDIAVGMIWSNVIAFFIIVTTASALNRQHASITTALDAAQALAPVAGPFAKYLFAVGIIGSGLVAIPVLAASTAYSLAGLLGWRRSLGREARNAPEFYLVLGITFLVGVQFAIAGLDPIRMLYYSQILDGVIAPFLVVFLVRLTASRKVMGDFASRPWITAIGWAAVVVLGAADLSLLVSLLLPTAGGG